MNKAIASIVIAAAVSTAFAAPSARVDFGSFGKLRIGMTTSELAVALGEPITQVNDQDQDCYYVESSATSSNMNFMILDHRLARIDIAGLDIQTSAGAKIGTPAATVMRLYSGRVDIAPHGHDGPEGQYLTVYSPDRALGVRFETDGKSVMTYYMGTAEAIGLKEGCS